MADTAFARKPNSEMLALIQGFYPDVTAFTWSLVAPASFTITSTDPLTQTQIDDICQEVFTWKNLKATPL